MEKKTGLIYLVLSFLVSFAFLSFSGFNLDIVMSPTGSVLNAISGDGLSFGFSIPYILAFLVTIPIPFIVFFRIALSDSSRDYSILTIPLLISVFVLLINGLTIFSAFASVGVLLSFLAVLMGTRSVEIYKKPPYRAIARSSFSKAFSYFSIIFTLGVFIFVFNQPALASDEIDSMLKSTLNMTQDDLNDLQDVVVEAQKITSYAMLENIEQVLLYSVLNTSYGLEPSESVRCFSALNRSMPDIDSAAKASIDAQLESGDAGGSFGSADMLKDMLDIIKVTYPFIVALTMFFVLRMGIMLAAVFTFIYLLFVDFDNLGIAEDADEKSSDAGKTPGKN